MSVFAWFSQIVIPRYSHILHHYHQIYIHRSLNLLDLCHHVDPLSYLPRNLPFISISSDYFRLSFTRLDLFENPLRCWNRNPPSRTSCLVASSGLPPGSSTLSSLFLALFGCTQYFWALPIMLPTPPPSPPFCPSLAPEERLGCVLAGRLELTSILGIGAYGVVYTALDIHTNIPYAVKALTKTGLDARQRRFQQREIRLHHRASLHPNVVSLVRILDSPDCTFVVIEFCPEGDLFPISLREDTLSAMTLWPSTPFYRFWTRFGTAIPSGFTTGT